MNFKRLLYTDSGRIVISIILGIGLATLFRKVCADGSCTVYKGPVIGEMDEKIYKHNNKCYTYKPNSVSCDSSKRILDF
jgi:hypothetical protein